MFSGPRSEYAIAQAANGRLTVTDLRPHSPDGTNTLEDIALLRFAGTAPRSYETVTVDDLTFDTTISGQVRDAQGQPMNGIALTLAAEGWPEQTATSDAGGVFGFTLADGIGARLDAARDYNPATDGRPTAMDALEVLRMAVGLNPSFGPAQAQNFIAADMNGDGAITALDALEVLRAAVGLESEHAPRWVFIDDNADLSHIDRGNVAYDTGIDLAAIHAEAQYSMSGILLGSMGEFA
ncbi:MAG: hypothetical protein JJU19_09445 [Pararhodobacter sp.]|nr:hypothetical protein [Pararhodobacter sp.]